MPGMETETVRSTPMTRRFSAQPAKNTSPSFEPKQANAQGVPEQFTRTKVVISQSEKTYVDTHTNQCHTIKSNSSLEKQCNALTSHLSPLTFSLSLSLSHLSPLTSHSHCHSPSHSWASQACHPSRFRVSLALFGQKTSKQTGMTSLGGLSSQSVSRFCDPFRPESPQTDWDDKPGFPRLVIPVRFGFCLARFGQKARNALG